MMALHDRSPALDHEMLELTNDFRGEHGLPALRWHTGLAKVARRHAILVAEGSAPFSHSGAPDRFAQCGTRCINVAENLARSDGFSREDLPGAAVNGWCNSEGHRRNLLGPFDACGIGWAASDSGTVFVTQLLALVDEQSTWRGKAKELATLYFSSTPAVCAGVALVLTGGPLLAITGGIAGVALERRYGLQLASAPRVLQDRASAWLQPKTCSSCRKSADSGDLLATSWAANSEDGGKLLCRQCHPSPADADVWCYVA
mmetsp:Transcript_167143/g.536842  ORF Transcript_167143/g.536842 Transcript_167143/m.536842 type:complete len:259 (-) Transcript_167143:314-1090(-)